MQTYRIPSNRIAVATSNRNVAVNQQSEEKKQFLKQASRTVDILRGSQPLKTDDLEKLADIFADKGVKKDGKKIEFEFPDYELAEPQDLTQKYEDDFYKKLRVKDGPNEKPQVAAGGKFGAAKAIRDKQAAANPSPPPTQSAMASTPSPPASENGASISSAPSPSIKESLNGDGGPAQASAPENGAVASSDRAAAGPLATPAAPQSPFGTPAVVSPFATSATPPTQPKAPMPAAFQASSQVASPFGGSSSPLDTIQPKKEYKPSYEPKDLNPKVGLAPSQDDDNNTMWDEIKNYLSKQDPEKVVFMITFPSMYVVFYLTWRVASSVGFFKFNG